MLGTMLTARRPVFAAGVLGLTLVLAGCAQSTAGSGAPGHTSARSSSAHSSTAPAPSPTPTPTATPADKAHLLTIALQTTDLPTGWTGAADDPDPTEASDQAQLVQCVGGTDTTPDKVAEAHSQDFSMNDATVSSQAVSYKSKDDINADV